MESMLLDSVLDSFVIELINKLKTHYLFNEVKDIHTYFDCMTVIDGSAVPKVELYIEFHKKAKDDMEFFISRLYSQSDEVRNKYYNDSKLFVTHIEIMEEKHMNMQKLRPTSFRKYTRNSKIEKLLENE